MLEGSHSYDYDLAVIGAGPGGTEVAKVVAEHDKKVALIEGNKVGGTCLNRGCIPAKTMIYAAKMYRQIDKMEEYGIRGIDKNSVIVDYPAMLDKRTKIIDKLQRGLMFQFERQPNIDLKEAFATLKDHHTISLDNGEEITADQIVLASGGFARRFPGFVEDDERFLTSDNIFELKKVPKAIAIVGGGPVGTEFASFYSTLGSTVYLIEKFDSLLLNYDETISESLKKALKSFGIKVHTGSVISKINRDGERLEIHLSSTEKFVVDYVLSAIGVHINADYTNGAGVALNALGKIKVNEEFQTSVPNIHALGDVIGKSGSAYGAEREARYIAYKLLGMDTSYAPVDYVSMPDVVFTFPEVATCGARASQLKVQGVDFITKTVQFLVNSKANVISETRGQIWVYIEKKTQRILGVHIIGAHATELIHTVPLILQNRMTVKDCLKCVWGHPVLAEILKDVLIMG